MKKNGITQLHGRGTFTSPTTVEIRSAAGDIEQVKFRHAIIATGSYPRMLPGIEKSERSSHVRGADPRTRPSRIDACRWRGGDRHGARICGPGLHVEVTVLESLDRVLPQEDAEVSRETEKSYQKLGITIVPSATVDSGTDDGEKVTVEYSRNGERQNLSVDRVLISVGFAPQVANIGLEAAGVALDYRGAIAIDERMRTNVPCIFAIGDVRGTTLQP